jgi:uncharacterized protein (TIGR02118 family)
MIHNFQFFARKPSLSQAEFDHYYIARHTRAGRRVDEMKRYIQNHRIHSLGGDSPFDAVSELWTERNMREWATTAGDPSYRPEYKADEVNFIDLTRSTYMAGTDRVLVDCEDRRSGMIQGVFQIRRPYGMTIPGFRSYWLDVHAPIVKTLPGLRHYQQVVVLDDVYGPPQFEIDPRFDGVEEIWFDDYEAAGRAVASVEYQRSFWPDFANFSECTCHFFAEVALLMWPGKSRDDVRREITERAARPWRE